MIMIAKIANQVELERTSLIKQVCHTIIARKVVISHSIYQLIEKMVVMYENLSAKHTQKKTRGFCEKRTAKAKF